MIRSIPGQKPAEEEVSPAKEAEKALAEAVSSVLTGTARPSQGNAKSVGKSATDPPNAQRRRRTRGTKVAKAPPWATKEQANPWTMQQSNQAGMLNPQNPREKLHHSE